MSGGMGVEGGRGEVSVVVQYLMQGGLGEIDVGYGWVGGGLG